jgi:hypothetical protein
MCDGTHPIKLVEGNAEAMCAIVFHPSTPSASVLDEEISQPVVQLTFRLFEKKKQSCLSR